MPFTKADYLKLKDVDKRNYFSVYKDGVQTWYHIKTHEMRNALRHMDGLSILPEDIGGGFFANIVSVLHRIIRSQSAMAIVQPVFAMRMVFKDWQNAFFRSKTGWMFPDILYGMWQGLPYLVPGLQHLFPNQFALFTARESGYAVQGKLAGFFQQNLALDVHKVARSEHGPS
jgi:hypothetical protein